MKIYPAIDIINGQVVRLTKGLFDQKTVYGDDPVAVAKSFAEQGATYLHVVDLDGAKAGKPMQTDLIQTIAAATNLKLQVGGGVRSADDVMTLVKAGVDRVIIGSLAVKDSTLTKRIFETFGADRITLGLDVSWNDRKEPMVATHGWQDVSTLRADELLSEYLPLGLNQVLCTDISRDGTLTGPNFDLYNELSLHFPTVSFLASGGLKTLDQVKKLKADRVAGAIIGKAIYEGTLDLKEAVRC